MSLALSLALGLGSALASTKKQVQAAPDMPAYQANSALNDLMAAGEFNRLSTEEIMKRFEAEGLFSGADGAAVKATVLAEIKQRRVDVLKGTQFEGRIDLETGIGRTPANPIRIRPLHSTIERNDASQWAWESDANQARSGFYPLPLANSITTYSYENDFVFRSGTTNANKAAADMADVITFGGTCPTPPEGIVSIEYLFNVFGTQPNGLRRRAFVWNTYNPSAAAGTSVFSNNLVTFNDDFGPTPVGLFYIEYLTVATPIFPTHADNIGIEFKFTDNVTGALTSTLTWFALGPAIGPFDGSPPSGSGPPTGTSANFFLRDQNADGVLATNEQLLFTTTPQPGNQNWANLNLHIGGRPPSTEIEPNNTSATANALCLCDSRTATAEAVDHYKFHVSSPSTMKIAVTSCATNSVTLTLRDSGAVVIGGPVSGCPGSITTGALPAGDYDVEVDGSGASYTITTTPLAAIVSGMKFTNAASKDTIVWNSQPNSLYDVVRGNISMLHSSGGNYADPAVVTDCWDVNLTTPTTNDGSTPTGPADSLFYLSRAKNSCGGTGSYNEGGNQVGSRDAEINANPNTSSCP